MNMNTNYVIDDGEGNYMDMDVESFKRDIVEPAREAARSLRVEELEACLRICQDLSCYLMVTCSACPVQIEGEVDGAYLYFRARSEHWRCTIGEDFSVGDKVEGGEFSASWMPPEQVEVALRRAITEYRNAHHHD